MKISCTLLSALLTSLCASTVGAQIVMVGGVSFGTKAQLTFTADASLNQLTVLVDNTFLGPNSSKGTVTGFGFNTPFTNVQLGTSGNAVSLLSVTWNLDNASGHTPPATAAARVAAWDQLFDPYDLSPLPILEFGVSTGNTEEGGSPQAGIEYGEKVTFVFQLPDFGASDAFLDSLIYNNQTLPGVAVRWKEVSYTVNNQTFTGQSDKGLPIFTPDPGPDPIPEPSTYGAIGAGLLAVCAFVRRMRSRSA